MSAFKHQLGKQSTRGLWPWESCLLLSKPVVRKDAKGKELHPPPPPPYRGEMPPVNPGNGSTSQGAADFPGTHPDCPVPHANLPSGRLLR